MLRKLRFIYIVLAGVSFTQAQAVAHKGNEEALGQSALLTPKAKMKSYVHQLELLDSSQNPGTPQDIEKIRKHAELVHQIMLLANLVPEDKINDLGTWAQSRRDYYTGKNLRQRAGFYELLRFSCQDGRPTPEMDELQGAVLLLEIQKNLLIKGAR